MDHYVYATSDFNDANKFTINLCDNLKLYGDWVCALKEISYNSGVYTLIDATFTVYSYTTFTIGKGITLPEEVKDKFDIINRRGGKFLIFRQPLTIFNDRIGEEMKSSANSNIKLEEGCSFKIIDRKIIRVGKKY